MNTEDTILAGGPLAGCDFSTSETDIARAQTLARERDVPMPEALELAVQERIERKRRMQDAGTLTAVIAPPTITKAPKIGEDDVFNVTVVCAGSLAVLVSIDDAPWTLYAGTFEAETGQSVACYGVAPGTLASEIVSAIV